MRGIRSFISPLFSDFKSGESDADGARAPHVPTPAPRTDERAPASSKSAFGVRRFINRLRGFDKSARTTVTLVPAAPAAQQAHGGAHVVRLEPGNGFGVLPGYQGQYRPAVSGQATGGRHGGLIQVAPPRFAGAQEPVRIAGTEYCRQAADLLIDANGRLDRTHLPRLLDELLEDGDKPAARRILGEHHRAHMVNTLLALQNDDVLAEMLNQVCEHVPLNDVAAGVVGNTLNIPSAHRRLGKADARKAVLAALMGNLRQGEVGSCFATGPAIAIHAESPRRMTAELAGLVETGSMRMRVGGSHVPVPLNSRCNTAAAREPLVVRADGACFGRASDAPVEAHWLHQQPGMIRALDALGIAGNARHYHVSLALQQLASRSGADRGAVFEASAYDVIRWLGHSTNAGTRRALGAYSSAEDVGLLRAWEYTLAAHASAVNVNEAVDSIAITALFGHSMPEYPHLRSPAAETGTIYARRLSEHPLFRHAPVQEIAEQLFTDVRAEISRRFYLEFDPGRKTAGDTRPAFGGYGGWVLCDLGVPSGKKSIRTAEAFQTARRSSAIRPGSVAIWTG